MSNPTWVVPKEFCNLEDARKRIATLEREATRLEGWSRKVEAERDDAVLRATTLERELAASQERNNELVDVAVVQDRKLAAIQATLEEAEDSIHTIILAFAREDWTKDETLNILRGTNKKLRAAIDEARKRDGT